VVILYNILLFCFMLPGMALVVEAESSLTVCCLFSVGSEKRDRVKFPILILKCVQIATLPYIVLSTNFMIFKFIMWRMSTNFCKLIKPKYQPMFLRLIVKYISAVKKYCSTKFVKLVCFFAIDTHPE